ncbi:lysophospholipid acyltransferase 2-like [Ptychodera flava]|uniref:lysophospholipid acyltransferase 2-like n=1 Tax=Ptychodera flava TaxID=63121 RepID=UPI003969C565
MTLGLSLIVDKVSVMTGLPSHRATFVIFQLCALPLAVLFRLVLHPRRVSSTIRHVFVTLIGFYMAVQLYSWSVVHLLVLSSTVYIMITVLQPSVFHYYVFVFSMLYLSAVNLAYQFVDGKTRDLTVTGPLMVMVQKLSSLAFSLKDGLTKADSYWNKRKKELAYSKMPSVLEYCSYLFYFQGLAVGPFCFYKPYIDFIEGKHLQSVPANSDNKEVTRKLQDPPVLKTAIVKLFLGSVMAVIYLTLEHHFPIQSNIDNQYIVNSSLVIRTFYLWMTVLIVQTKYFYVWMWADAVCNTSGLGFNGYNENGSPKWNLVSNIDLMAFMFATSGKGVVDNWNILTTLWLRYVCYDRVQSKFRTVMTFFLSSVWHGFYPGYFWTFLSGPFVLEAGKKVRQFIRPFFLRSPQIKLMYDIITWFFTHVMLAYTALPFVMLHGTNIIRFYRSVYFIGHLGCLLVIVILPKRKRAPSDGQSNGKSVCVDGREESNVKIGNNVKTS